MLTYFILFLILLIGYLIHTTKQRDKNFPPGPPRLPLYGSYWFFLAINYKYFHKALIYYSKKYNTNILGFYLGNTPSIATFDYESCKEILTKKEFNMRPVLPFVWERCMGKLGGIFFGNNWREQKMISLRYLKHLGFGRKSCELEKFIESEIRNLVEIFTNEPNDATNDVCREKGIVYMSEIYQGHLLNIMLFILTGTRLDYYKLREFCRTKQRFARSVDATGSAISMTPWLRFIAPNFFGFTSGRRDNKDLFNFLQTEIEEHKTRFIKENPENFIDMYLKELENLKENDKNTSMSEYEMLMCAFDFISPVPISMSDTLNLIFAYLIHHPEIQAKIQAEIDNVVGKTRYPSLNDRADMPYTEATIRETIRINPTNPVGVFRVALETTELCGYTIPKGTLIYPCVYAVHLDSKLWGDPENFRPERWLDNNGKLIKKDYTLGFGAGKRSCPGETFARQTIFLLISGLLQHFTFVTPNNEKKPDLDNIIPGISVAVANYWIKAVQR